MNMKNRLILLLASAAVAAGGCSENETPADSDGYGTLRIACRTDAMITTRAEIAVTPVPDAGDLSLTISGTEFSKTWESLSAFNDAGETIPAGSYTAELRYGDPKAEGVGKVCYYGSKAIEIVARQRVEETIPVQIANAQVLVSATESFLNYFHDATFTVTTSAGNRFTFTPGAETADEAVFVEAGTTLTLTGTAKLQSQTGHGLRPRLHLPRAAARPDRRPHAPYVPFRRPGQRQRHADDQPPRRLPRRTHDRRRAERRFPVTP